MTNSLLGKVLRNALLVGVSLSWLQAPTSVRAADEFSADDEFAQYLRDVKPVLKNRCFSCHGALKQEAGLRLDTGDLIRRGADSGTVIEPGNVDVGALFDRVTSSDESERMPPEGEPLTAEQIAHLRTWIAAGATSPADEQPERDPKSHWSFQRPIKRPLPAVTDARWANHPVDAFIRSQQESRGIEPLELAKRELLLRRVYLDLIGLPPTREQLRTFLDDSSADAYARVVDELLASQHHGERWGRHWMDVWRYSDWYGRRQVGDVRNSYPHIWRWRDWIVGSLNDDKGYDQMIREMIAADELHPGDDSRAPALGFIVRNWFSLNYDTWKQDLVEHTGKAFLALRFNCAHCHDHKYDPISQEEYFRFRAFFEPLELRHDRVPGGGPLDKYMRYVPSSSGSLKPIAAGLPRVYDLTMEEKTHMYRLGDTRDRLDRPPVTAGVPAILSDHPLSIASVSLPPAAYYPALRPFVAEEELAKHRAEIESFTEALGKATQTAAPGRDELVRAQTELSQAEAAFNKSRIAGNGATSNAARDSEQQIGWWRFEGDADEQFLADSSAHRHNLVRVNGGAPPASPRQLAVGTTRAFLAKLPVGPLEKSVGPLEKSVGPLEKSGGPLQKSGGPLQNTWAAEFQQDQSFAYLATSSSSPADALYANQFSLEAFVHFDVSIKNYNRTIADLDGSWTLLHRGLDGATFELRVRYLNDSGQLRDVATGQVSSLGCPPLVLQTGHDHYLCLVLGREKVGIWAADLTARTPLRFYEFPRHSEEHKFDPLKQPARSTPLKIGNSDGTGRFDGLIDEVRYTRQLLTEEQIAAVVGQPASPAVRTAADKVTHLRQELGTAELAVRLCERQLVQARAEHVWTEARHTADRARYLAKDSLNGSDVAAQTFAAVQAEHQVNIARQETNLANAEHALATLASDAKKNAAKITESEKAKSAAQTALAGLRKKELSPKDPYTARGPIYPDVSSGRRRALAMWLSDNDNPLTARVAVNHIWMRHFGRPLVESVFDFGRSGEEPTHPELLDWLAVELMENGWSMKHLHRLIVTSRTYQLSSRPGAQHLNLEHDKDNKTWWKAERRRLESEVIRDSMLFVAGQLDATFGGPEVDVKNELTSRRRSMYFSIYPEAGGTMPFMTVFDPPDPGDCYRRTDSIVPQQALAMVNSELGVSQGRLLARRLAKPEQTDEEFVTALFETTLSRLPKSLELAACVGFLARQRKLYAATAPAELQTKGSERVPAAATDPNLRARESLARTLLNHNDFVTVH